MIPLLLTLFHHVTISGIPATVYENHGDALSMHVASSASFLFIPYDAPKSVHSVTFDWRLVKGSFPKKPKDDDAVVRIGLMIEGPAPLVPFLAPSWIKAVRDHSRIPADRMTFVLAGRNDPPGKTWPSPMSDDLTLVAATDQRNRDGWHHATHDFAKPLSVVGVWIMADGDDSGSSYDAELRNLDLK